MLFVSRYHQVSYVLIVSQPDGEETKLNVVSGNAGHHHGGADDDDEGDSSIYDFKV